MFVKRWHVPAISLGTALIVMLFTTGAASAAGTNTLETSDVWGGYQASVAGNASVSANWTVPSETCSGFSVANLWIGLGDTQMAGVTGSCENDFSVWTAWLGPGVAAGDLTDYVQSGDSISASATYDGYNSTYDTYYYSIVLTDHTQNWTESLDDVGVYGSSLGDTAQIGVEPQTLECLPPSIDYCFYEWVSEPLADFGTVDFTGAEVDGTPIGNGTTDQTNLVSGSTTEVTTSSLDSTGEKFSITYQG
jgi:hypothetical protein